METTIAGSTSLSGNDSLKKILLYCGIVSTLLYIGTDIFATLWWDDYSFAGQTVSELIAIDAPTRSIVVPLFTVYALLVYAFGVGVWISSGQKRALRFTAVGMIGKEVLGLVVTLFFPIHLRGVEGTYTDTMHIILTAVGVFLFMFPAMLFGASAFGKRFRIYSIITIAIFLLCGVLTGTESPQMEANLPTPWIGILERINIYCYFLWVIVLANIMLRLEKGNNSH